MLSLTTQQLQSVFTQTPEHSISSSEINTILQRKDEIIQQFHTRKQGWVDITADVELAEQINQFASSIQGKYTDIVILGIGGSMLGPKTLLDALYYTKSKDINIHTLDNIDPYVTNHVANIINLPTTLFLVQTKSGGTPETVAQYLFFKDQIEGQGLSVADHFVFVTDPKDGYLRSQAEELDVPSFPIAPNVGGRFSVLTPVGLLILAILGFDIQAMLQAAHNLAQDTLSGKNTDALTLAATQLLLSQKGKNMNVVMPYSSRLATFANWYVQLLSESIGKEFNLNGEVVHTGITPIPAIGATDQHSQMQLFKEGPNDKLLIFIEVKNHQVLLPITNQQLPQSLDYLKNKSFSDLLDAEFQATRQSLTESGRPSVTIQIDEVNEKTLGELFMFFQFSTAFVGELLNIDTYNQPGVERSKVLTKEYLVKS